MSFTKGELEYEGKAKRIYKVLESDKYCWMEFKDSLTAFNGVKKESMDGKGVINKKISTLIFKYLESKNIETHMVESISDTEQVCQKIKIIELEVVVRNILAGSTAKKFQIEEGTKLNKPLVEFYYKKDELNDPFISDEQALMLNTVDSQSTLDQLKKMALEINLLLISLFDKAEINLVDFKLEFGVTADGNVILGDEISPDSCRLWEKGSNKKLDKDRFRRDLGDVKKSYEDVLKRLTQIIEV